MQFSCRSNTALTWLGFNHGMKYPNTILFICTGNYYRSRFAEALFNFTCHLDKVHWRAVSRGLNTASAEGPLSPLARERLKNQSIALSFTHEQPEGLTEQDLKNCYLAIAMREREHRPMIKEQFPDYENRLMYWHIPNIDRMDPGLSLSIIEAQVEELINRLPIRNPAVPI